MIPLRYRKKLPPYWYENEVAETHFEAAGGEMDFQHEKSKDFQNQFILSKATWGLDFWDWIYFGETLFGSYEERRENIRNKRLAKAKFKLPTLRKLGSLAGKLIDVQEDFENQEIVFVFKAEQPVLLPPLIKAFERIRPVHVLRSRMVVESQSEPIILNASARFFEVDFPICGEFYPDGDIDGSISRESIIVSGSARTLTADYPITNDFYPAAE